MYIGKSTLVNRFALFLNIFSSSSLGEGGPLLTLSMSNIWPQSNCAFEGVGEGKRRRREGEEKEERVEALKIRSVNDNKA